MKWVLHDLSRIDGGVVEDYRVKIEGSARKVIESLKIDDGFKFTVNSTYPSHSGLGSGTQLSLAVAKLITMMDGREMTAYDLAKIVGRGGTSGIGVESFENGGFIVDGGHKSSEKPNFLPSSASNASPAPIIARYNFPLDWKIIILVPNVEEFLVLRKLMHSRVTVQYHWRMLRNYHTSC